MLSCRDLMSRGGVIDKEGKSRHAALTGNTSCFWVNKRRWLKEFTSPGGWFSLVG